MFIFWDVLGKVYYIANPCPIIIPFNALDFNECRSEEVISFFWRSVYYFFSNDSAMPVSNACQLTKFNQL